MKKPRDLEEVLREPAAKNIYLTPGGREMPDPTPMSPPVGYKKQPSMVEIVRNMIRSEKLAQEAAEAGMETFEESEDFEIGDDYDPSSPYESDYDPPVRDIRTAVEAEKAAEAAKKGVEGDTPSAKPKPPKAAPGAKGPPAEPSDD